MRTEQLPFRLAQSENRESGSWPREVRQDLENSKNQLKLSKILAPNTFPLPGQFEIVVQKDALVCGEQIKTNARGIAKVKPIEAVEQRFGQRTQSS